MRRKTISQNHPWRYFDISFAFSPKSRNERSASRTWHQYQIAHLHAAKRYSVRQPDLTEETRKDWKVTQEKRCLNGSSKKSWHTDQFAVKAKLFSTTDYPKHPELTSILMWHVTVTNLIHNTLMVTCHKSHSLWHHNFTAKESKATPREGVSYVPSRSHFSLWYDTRHRPFYRPQERDKRIEPIAFPAYQSPMVIPVVNVWNFGP